MKAIGFSKVEMPFVEELQWYSNDDESEIGCVFLDKIDKNYSLSLFLKSDDDHIFECYNTLVDFNTFYEAQKWLSDKWAIGYK